jgi:hypothetical protein
MKFRLFQTKRSLQKIILNLVKSAKNTFKLVENTVGKEKLLITSNFSFSHRVLKRHTLQTKKRLLWERVNLLKW